MMAILRKQLNEKSLWFWVVQLGLISLFFVLLNATPSLEGNAELSVTPPVKQEMISFNHVFYFNAKGALGEELYQQHEESTPQLVADIYQGSNSSSPTNLTIFNNKLYFSARNEQGENLYRYDGITTPKRITNNVAGVFTAINNLIVFHNKLYFTAYSNQRWSLFQYANNYIHLVSDIGKPMNQSGLTILSNKLYITTADALYSFNGHSVSNITEHLKIHSPTDLIVVDQKLYFTASNYMIGGELYQYDGINLPVAIDINPGAASSFPTNLTAFKGQLYFSADAGTVGHELYRLDAKSRPQLVANIASGYLSSKIANLTVSDQYLFFSANDRIHGSELYQYNGKDTPLMVADINEGSGSSNPEQLVWQDQVLYFSAFNGKCSRELFRLTNLDKTTKVSLLAQTKSFLSNSDILTK